MSFAIINGREVEILDEPSFFEPKPVSPKRKNNILFAQANGTIHLNIEELEQPEYNIPSILGKRKLEDAFGSGNLDEERYGQTVEDDFFKVNVGHGIVCKPIIQNQEKRETINFDPEEILNWCYEYLASKNLNK